MPNVTIVAAISATNCGQITSRLWSRDSRLLTAWSACPAVTSPGVLVRMVGLRTAPVASKKSWLGDRRCRFTCVWVFAIVSGLAFDESGETGEIKPATTPTTRLKNTLISSHADRAMIADVAARLTSTEQSNANASQNPMYTNA